MGFITDDCIEWDRCCESSGYGKRTINGKTDRVHRLAWIEVHGPIPDGLCVLHKCDNPPCFNVDHLFLGTRKDNGDDKIAKDRQGPRTGKKLSEDDALTIRYLFRFGMKQPEIAKKFSMSVTNVMSICTRRTWKHLT